MPRGVPACPWGDPGGARGGRGTWEMPPGARGVPRGAPWHPGVPKNAPVCLGGPPGCLWMKGMVAIREDSEQWPKRAPVRHLHASPMVFGKPGCRGHHLPGMGPTCAPRAPGVCMPHEGRGVTPSALPAQQRTRKGSPCLLHLRAPKSRGWASGKQGVWC